MAVGERGHARLGGALVRVHPSVAFVEPDFVVAFRAPRRRRELLRLERRARVEIIAGGDARDLGAVFVQLSKNEVEKLDPFVPPMAEQLCVVGRDDERRAMVERWSNARGLCDPLADEMLRVGARAAACGTRAVRLFLFLRHFAPGDAVEFQAEMPPLAVGV